MLSAERQLRWIEVLLLSTGGVSSVAGLTVVEQDDRSGSLNIQLRFPTGHHLSASLDLDVTSDFPGWTQYSFHLQDGSGRCVFRYDNAAHYPEMPTFSHHKHVGPDE